MKNITLSSIGLCLIALMYSCGTQESTSTQKVSSQAPSPTVGLSTADVSPYFITKDIANGMINSYTQSIGGYDSLGNDLSSWVLNADGLRAYLSDTSIKEVKIMLAHTENYINSGHQGQPAGYNKDALTIVVSGVNQNGDYVLYNTEMVMDRAIPCPNNCPKGNAVMPTIEASH